MSERTLKVLLFAGPFEVRGKSSYTLRLAEELDAAAVEAVIVTPNADRIETERRAQLPIRVFPNLTVPIWGRVVLESMRSELAEDPPDLIHIQSADILPFGTALAAQLERPWVVTVHGATQRDRLSFDRTWFRGLIAVSDYVANELESRFGISGDVIRMIHPGVGDEGKFATPQVLDPNHIPVVGSAGPLETTKGIPYFLRAARQVLSSHPKVQFLVAGAGPEEPHLRQLTRDLGFESSVTFIPNLYDFKSAIAAMDVFCLPSLRQGLGSVMLEAMALGKPVIASDVGGVSSVVCHDENGLLVPPADSYRLAERILELLNEPVRARFIGEAGRRLIHQQYSLRKMAERTIKVYRQALEESASASA